MAGKENREIKNSVFVDLFYEDESAEANEIALFNAIHDKPLPEGTKIRRFRVDNTIYMNFQNDISFDAGGKVIIFGRASVYGQRKHAPSESAVHRTRL